VTELVGAQQPPWRTWEELRKLPAFLRRDVLVMLSYRAMFIGDVLSLLLQALLFSYLAKLIDASTLPTYNGRHAGYLEFATIGIAVAAFAQIGLSRAATAVRNEQLMGTLEPMLSTPTSVETVQVGSVMLDLVYVPLRTTAFFGLMVAVYGLAFHWDGLVPALLILLLLVPSVWGLGIIGAAAIMTFRRGTGTVGLFAMLLALASGAYFPLALLPPWLHTVMAATPLAIALERIRDALLGGSGWTGIGFASAELLAWAIVTLGLGLFAFRLALRREQRLGTLGLY
jgi:ABC-2 type transport system permease protein